jgi:glycosyltransferase involved in cell wall biosynthesis
MSVKRVAIIHTHLTWNRTPVFELIAKEQNINLTVFSTRSTATNKYKHNFNHIELIQKNYLDFLKNSIILFVNILKGKYNVIIWAETIFRFELLLLLFIKKFIHTKVIIWADAWGWRKPLRRRILEPYTIFIYRMSDKIITHGRKHYKYFRRMGLPKYKISIIRHTSLVKVDEERIKKAIELKKKYAGDNKVILYTGRLVERKGVEYLIRAFKLLIEEMNKVELWIGGDGPQNKKLVYLAKELGLMNKCKFFGWRKSHDEIAPYMIACDVFVLPSITHNKEGAEPWGAVVNEALWASRPVVVTDAVGCSEDLVINGYNGYVVKEKDIEGLKNAIKDIIINEEKFIQFKTNAYKVIEKYTYENMAKDIVNSISDIL